MDYLKLFQNHSEYEAFVSGGTMVKPNVSHCVAENEVHYNPIAHEEGIDVIQAFTAILDERGISYYSGSVYADCFEGDDGKFVLRMRYNYDDDLFLKDMVTQIDNNYVLLGFEGVYENGEVLITNGSEGWKSGEWLYSDIGGDYNIPFEIQQGLAMELNNSEAQIMLNALSYNAANSIPIQSSY